MVRIQDTCKVAGQKNPHGVSMEIREPMTVADTVNFSVDSPKPLPYNIGATDTIFFHLCLKAKDGKKHTTQIKYSSTHGAISYTITMQAPSSAGVGSSGLKASIGISAYPNPAKEHIIFRTDNETDFDQVQIVDERGAVLQTQVLQAGGMTDLPTSDLANGRYHAILKSKGTVLGSKGFVVVK